MFSTCGGIRRYPEHPDVVPSEAVDIKAVMTADFPVHFRRTLHEEIRETSVGQTHPNYHRGIIREFISRIVPKNGSREGYQRKLRHSKARDFKRNGFYAMS